MLEYVDHFEGSPLIKTLTDKLYITNTLTGKLTIYRKQTTHVFLITKLHNIQSQTAKSSDA